MSINQLRHCYCGCRDYRPTVVPSPLKDTQFHMLKVVLGWHDVWQHCILGYCKSSGVRFNKICVFRVKKQINLKLT